MTAALAPRLVIAEPIDQLKKGRRLRLGIVRIAQDENVRSARDQQRSPGRGELAAEANQQIRASGPTVQPPNLGREARRITRRLEADRVENVDVEVGRRKGQRLRDIANPGDVERGKVEQPARVESSRGSDPEK